MAAGTIITLVIALTYPGQRPIEHSEVVESLALCWAMARDLVRTAQTGSLKLGGQFIAGCQVEVPTAQEH